MLQTFDITHKIDIFIIQNITVHNTRVNREIKFLTADTILSFVSFQQVNIFHNTPLFYNLHSQLVNYASV